MTELFTEFELTVLTTDAELLTGLTDELATDDKLATDDERATELKILTLLG